MCSRADRESEMKESSFADLQIGSLNSRFYEKLSSERVLLIYDDLFFTFFYFYPARERSTRARRACALRALGLLLADGAPTVGGGKTF